MAVTTNSTSVTITSGDSSVEILAFGATVISWKIKGQEQLFLSSGSKLDGSRAVRGGIPLVFPRFGPPNSAHAATAKLPQHGFARSVNWELLGQQDESTVQFGLGPENLSEEFRSAWPYDFTLVYTVRLGDSTLDISLDLDNPGETAFDFNVLFHTYFAVPDVRKVSVTGLKGLSYYNKLEASNIPEEKNDVVSFEGEVDRVYADTPQTQTIEFEGKTRFEITPRNLKDTVVWNPWIKTAEGMSDFEPKDGYLKMVCVENGSVKDFVALEPGKSWTGAVQIRSLL